MQRFIVCALILVSIFSQQAHAEVEEAPDWYGATTPVMTYHKDQGADLNYQFGSFGTFSEYSDPDIEEAKSLANPLDDERYRSYNLIVVVNKRDHSYWGRKQTLRVYMRGVGLMYYWLISTGRDDFKTTSGFYTPQRFSSRHWSSAYNAPMFWSVFFNGGMALHSSITSSDIRKLGEQASHGCVHIEDNRAKELFHMIGQSGYGDVEKINYRTGRRVLNENGEPIIVQRYKTLIIVPTI